MIQKTLSMGLGFVLAIGVTTEAYAMSAAPLRDRSSNNVPPSNIPPSNISLSKGRLSNVLPSSALPKIKPGHSLNQPKNFAQYTSIQIAQTPSTQSQNSNRSPHNPSEQLDLDPRVIENSPVLQRWLHQIPDVLSEIRNDPSFRTRLRLGYSNFPSTNDTSGINIGIEDVFVGHTPLTFNADYQTSFNGRREAYGADLRYYVLPLGSSINLAPVAGYRSVKGDRYHTDGVNVGLRLLLELSRTGAADIAITQSWVAPGSDEEVGITTLSFGYALTHNLRITTDLQQQNAPRQKDNRAGIGLEWML